MPGPTNISAISFNELSDTEVLPGISNDAEKFERALSSVPDGHFTVKQHTLTAADDAWVGFLATSEKLQNPQLPAEKKAALIKELAQTWRAFLNQSAPLANQIEDFIAQHMSEADIGPK